ncbi:MAG: hypothetical protein GC190_20320 [Alphaproteobacteria bacterium]|nr:hypothetical protein [Alphaproteobacteria bacterium]
MRILAATLILAAGTATAFAGQPSAVLPHPTYRPNLPISVASNSARAADEIPDACELKRVMRIDDGVAKAIRHGVAFDAFGQAESAGWKHAQLVLAYQEHGVATVDFVACRPEASAQVATPVETHMGLGLAPDTRRVVIRTRTNTLSVEVR